MSGPALLAAAMILDAVLGEPRWLWSRLPHPAVMMGRAVAALDRRLNHGPSRRARGVAALSALVAAAGFAGWSVSLLGPVAEVICAAILLAQKSLAEHVSAVAIALRRSVSEGRKAVSMIVGRDTEHMTAPQVARAAIESAAENLSDGVTAPAFWFLVAGLPGMAVYKAVNTADSMIGHRNDRYGAFGWASARLDDALNLVPARLTGLVIAATTGGLGNWADIVADARRHRSPNAGWPEAAMARALDVALAGPRSYDGKTREFDWVNRNGRRDIGADAIDAAVSLLWRVWAAALALAVATAVLLALV